MIVKMDMTVGFFYYWTESDTIKITIIIMVMRKLMKTNNKTYVKNIGKTLDMTKQNQA